jgi:hypothetical protein
VLKKLTLDLGRPRKLFRLLWWEASFAVAYETWIHPTYLNGLAGELKIPLSLVSVLAAIPWIGATGQILGAWAFQRSHSVRRYVLGMASFGRALWLLPLLFAVFWGSRSYFYGIPFPVSNWFILATTSACISSFLTTASSNAWLYWMKVLVPSQFQGRFFGTRQRFTTSAFISASLIGALLVGWTPQGYRVGNGLLCTFALLSGCISIYLHSFVRDVPYQKPQLLHRASFSTILRKPLSDPQFREFLLFGAQFNGAIQIANSYFPYYFTKELHFSMSTIALWTGISNFGCFIAAAYWGRKVDRCRTPFEILWYAGHLIAFSPLVYVFIKEPGVVQAIAPFEYFGYGLAWSGFLLAQTKLLFKLSPKTDCAPYFSTYAAVCGISGAVCTFLGGQLAQAFAPWGGFRILWVFGCLARLTILWLFCRPLLQIKNKIRNEPELQSI